MFIYLRQVTTDTTNKVNTKAQVDELMSFLTVIGM